MILLYIILSIISSKGCDYSINTIDDFTGRRVIQTKGKNIAGDIANGTIRLSAMAEGSDTYLVFYVSRNNIWIAEPSDTWYLKLSDGKVIELHPSEVVAGDYDMGIDRFKGYVYLSIDDHTAKVLTSASLDKMRRPLDRTWDVEIYKKRRNDLAHHLGCLGM